MNRFILAGSLVLLMSPGQGHAGGLPEARARMAIEPEAIYPELLRLAQEGKWERLKKALAVVKPLILQIDRTRHLSLDEDLQQAISVHDKPKTQMLVKTLIGEDINSLLMESRKEIDPTQRRKKIGEAFNEYLILEPFLVTVNRATARKIGQALQNAFQVQEQVTNDPPDTRAIQHMLREVLEEMQRKA